MTTTPPAPRPLTVPEQRALEWLAQNDAADPIGQMLRGHLWYLTDRGLAGTSIMGWHITDRGRAYLRTLGVE